MDDVTQISHLHSMYALAIDAKQWDLFDRVFTPDVHADYPGRAWTDLASWRGPEDLLRFSAGDSLLVHPVLDEEPIDSVIAPAHIRGDRQRHYGIARAPRNRTPAHR